MPTQRLSMFPASVSFSLNLPMAILYLGYEAGAVLIPFIPSLVSLDHTVTAFYQPPWFQGASALFECYHVHDITVIRLWKRKNDSCSVDSVDIFWFHFNRRREGVEHTSVLWVLRCNSRPR